MTITLPLGAVLAAGAFISTLSMLLLLGTWRAAGRPAYLAAWAGFCGLGTIAVLLHALRGQVPEALLILVATPIYILAMALFWAGARRLRGAVAPGWAVALPLLPWYAGCAVPAVYAAVDARVALGTVIFAALGTAGGVELLRLRGSASLRRVARTVAIVVLFSNSLPVWRAGQALLGLPVSFSGAGYLLGTLLFVTTGFAGLALASVQAGERDAGLVAAAAQREAAALAAGRAEIERLLSGLPVIVFLRDVAADGSSRLVYRNGDTETVTGWPPAEILPRDRVWHLTGPERQDFSELARTILRDGEGRLEWRLRRPDGRWTWLRSHGRRLALRPDGGSEVVGYVVNIDAEREAVARIGAAEAAREYAAATLRESEARWHGLFSRMQEGVALCELVGGGPGPPADFRLLEVNAAWEALTGLPAAAAVGRLLTEAVPELARGWIDSYARVAETGEPARAEYRLATLDRWFEVLAYRTEPGRIALLLLDVTDRKRAEARQALLAREVDHRAKNALAVVQSVLRLTQAPDLPSFIRTVEGRVAALGRAQSLLASTRWDGADLRALLEGELAPFLGGQRLELRGPPVVLPAVAAQPVAMAVHELATNAVKHGALSVPGGMLAVRWTVRPARPTRLRLRWAEAGGPPVAGAPARRGFGSRVLEGTVRGQLGGAVELDWAASGLVCELDVPLEGQAG
ncbi:HWE histidine kinase domain-containing protein [Dankookia sp. GCM10030260]|uniref:HWE histidine kinase domain-containing protein n=1 Tax=Dankookia sp. GCM10030260 TaxID=3273390 RepID=UPI0036221451